MTSVDIVEIVKCGGFLLEVSENFFCHTLENNTYTEIIPDMFVKRALFESQGKDILQKLATKIALSVYSVNCRKDTNEE